MLMISSFKSSLALIPSPSEQMIQNLDTVFKKAFSEILGERGHGGLEEQWRKVLNSMANRVGVDMLGSHNSSTFSRHRMSLEKLLLPKMSVQRTSNLQIVLLYFKILGTVQTVIRDDESFSMGRPSIPSTRIWRSLLTTTVNLVEKTFKKFSARHAIVQEAGKAENLEFSSILAQCESNRALGKSDRQLGKILSTENSSPSPTFIHSGILFLMRKA